MVFSVEFNLRYSFSLFPSFIVSFFLSLSLYLSLLSFSFFTNFVVSLARSLTGYCDWNTYTGVKNTFVLKSAGGYALPDC
jgi:hypothetical protein